MSTPIFKNGIWICENLPPGKVCCPSGPIDQAQQLYNRHGIEVFAGGCPDSPDIVACGPRPAGDVKCCEYANVWVPSKTECSIRSGKRGIDLDILQIVSKYQVIKNAKSNLVLIGIPIIIAIIILLVLLIRK